MSMNNVMIDLETLATSNDAVVCSLGAVLFDPDTGEQGYTYYMRVDWTKQPGRMLCMKTLLWWLKQAAAARDELIECAATGVEFKDALRDFKAWLPADCIPWSNGKEFDIKILEHACAQYDIEVPWHYAAAMDCRTIEKAAAGQVSRKDFTRNGTHHNALDDAIYQATYTAEMWQAVRGNAAPVEVLKLAADGKIFVHGKEIGSSIEVYEGMLNLIKSMPGVEGEVIDRNADTASGGSELEKIKKENTWLRKFAHDLGGCPDCGDEITCCDCDPLPGADDDDDEQAGE